MLAFLQIVLAVVLVLVVSIAIGWWWIKRRLKHAVGDYSVAAELVDPAGFLPARLHLYRSDAADCGSRFAALGEQIAGLGFQRMAGFSDDNCAFQHLHAARHRELPVAAAMIEDNSGNAFFTLFALDSERRVVARGSGPGGSLSTARLDWQVDADLEPESALAQLCESLSKDNLAIDLRLFREVCEQAYAVRMDQQIVHRPTPEAIDRRVAEQSIPATPEQIEHAYAMVLEHWKLQLEEAVLDRYRRTSSIDAVTWEKLRDSVHVVHSRIDEDDVESMLVVDELSERIFEQCKAQGLGGIELYRAVVRQLPADRQWTEIGTVDRPVKALLFAPNEDIGTDAAPARQYVYDASDENGRTVHGAVFAQNGGDAKRQIRNLGLQNSRLLIEPLAGADRLDNALIDDRRVATAAKSVQEGILGAVMRALVGNWWIWAPPSVFVGLMIEDPSPLTWGDYATIAWAVAAAAAMVFLIGPVIAYNQLLLARLKARPAPARVCLRILRVLNVFGGMSDAQLAAEQCKLLVMEDRLDEALELWAGMRQRVAEDEYQTTLAQIYDCAGDHRSMIAAQRAFLAITPARDLATVDLAMSVARYSDDASEAEALIDSVSPADLSEIALACYQYVRGLLAARRGQYEQALKHYAQSTETASQFVSLPIVLGLIAEINGYAALALKHSGEQGRAQELWEQVAPILKLHRSADRLVADYESC